MAGAKDVGYVNMHASWSKPPILGGVASLLGSANELPSRPKDSMNRFRPLFRLNLFQVKAGF